MPPSVEAVTPAGYFGVCRSTEPPKVWANTPLLAARLAEGDCAHNTPFQTGCTSVRERSKAVAPRIADIGADGQ